MAEISKKILKRKWFLVFILLLSSAPAFIRLIRPGFFPMQDDLQAFRLYEMDKCFQDLQIPCRWVPDAGYQYGYPQFNYYPPLPYYFGEIIHLLGFGFIDSIKILFILGYILSLLTMYLLVSSIVGKWPAFVSAILYTYIPYKAVEVYVRGALNEFWSLVFFPLVFWAIYGLIKTGKIKYTIWLALSSAFLLTTHSLVTMIFVPSALVWTAFWLISKKNWRVLPKLIAGGVLAFGLSGFFILPLIFERKFAHLETLLYGYFDYRQHFVNLYRLFISREWGYGSSGFPNEKLNLSTGLVQWILALLSGFLVALSFNKNKKRSSLVSTLFGLELLTLFMIHLKSSFIWEKITFLAWLQFPWRFLSVSIFLLSVICGLSLNYFKKFRVVVGLLAIILAIVLNVGYFKPKEWLNISDKEKFSGNLWEKQLTISIFDYLPTYAFLPPPAKAPGLPEVLEGEVEFLEYKKGSNWQQGKLTASEGGAVLRLPLFDFPGMIVKVDNNKVNYWHNDCRNQSYCLGLIVFKVPAGEHKIEATLTNTLVRQIGNALTLFSLAIVVFYFFKVMKK